MAQKSIDQLHKNWLESSKTPIIFKVPKIPMIMHEKCMKSRNKLGKDGQKGLTGFQRQKPSKNLEGKRQKLMVEPSANAERERNFEKV